MGGKMHIGRGIIAGACGVVCVGMGAPALAATEKPAGGQIQFIVQPGNEQGSGKIVVTGAIGDYGTTSPSKHAGHKVYGIAKLKKGSFEVDLTKIEKKMNSQNPPVNQSTCSAELSGTAPAKISKGTGLYKGISGSVSLTESFAFIGPRYTSGPKKGQCNLGNNAKPVAVMGTVYGKGTVRF
jgi:hypothetical protein